MAKCTECDDECGAGPLVLEQAGERSWFCSLECLITYAVAGIQKRLAGQNRRMERLARQQRRCQIPPQHRASHCANGSAGSFPDGILEK
jgi:hypothetical protein